MNCSTLKRVLSSQLPKALLGNLPDMSTVSLQPELPLPKPKVLPPMITFRNLSQKLLKNVKQNQILSSTVIDVVTEDTDYAI